MSSQDPIDLALVGGGIAGITLALGLLKQTNHKITLYESAHAFGEIGAGVAFGPNATKAMQLLDSKIHEGFERRATRNQWEEKQHYWFDFRVGMDEDDRGENDAGGAGNYVYSLKCPDGQASVHRAHYLDEMVKLLPEGVAKFSHRLVDIDDSDPSGVLLKFADGSDARHDAVIGCDGIKSRTRQLVLGEDSKAAHAVFTGKYCYRGLLPMKRAKELLGDELAENSQMYMGKHGHVLTFPIEKGKVMNVVAFNSEKEWKHKEWVVSMDKKDMEADFEGWGDNVKKILSLMQKPDIWALFDHPPADTYVKGRVCLTGDAAHASTPHQGAGAGMAVEDAYTMTCLLANVKEAKNLQAAFRAFDAVRRERTERLVTSSREAGQLYEFEQPGVGDDLGKIKEKLSTRMSWIWDFDHEAERIEAQKAFEKFRTQ